MKNCIKVSLLSILLLMFCTLAMNAADNKPIAQIGFTAPLRTTVEIVTTQHPLWAMSNRLTVVLQQELH